MKQSIVSDTVAGVGDVSGLGAAAIVAWGAGLVGIDRDVCDGERIDQLRALEQLKAQAAAAQAQVAVDFAASQRREQTAAGVPAALRGRGIGAQIALARRDSPFRGSRHLGLAQAPLEMPHTRAAFAAGLLSEWRVTLLVRETACLNITDRQHIDELICADPAQLEGLGDQALVAKTKKLAATLDPASVVARNRKAVADRRVSCRPAPDTMCYLTALLPVGQGVAAYAALCKAADRITVGGDARGRGQIMADTLVERLTGQTTADAVPVEVNVIISDQSLLAGGTEPAHLDGYGPIPATMARQLAHCAAEAQMASLRKFYTHRGSLTALKSRARCFPAGLKRFLNIRDQTCRTPWCDAPIRHHDHIDAYDHGGPTTADNGQGLCETCNHAKQAPGWHATTRAGPRAAPGGHIVETITPTGHTYTSVAPDLPKAASPPGQTAAESPFTNEFTELNLSA